MTAKDKLAQLREKLNAMSQIGRISVDEDIMKTTKEEAHLLITLAVLGNAMNTVLKQYEEGETADHGRMEVDL